MIPKVEFKLTKVDDYVKILDEFIFKTERQKEMIFYRYPILKERLKNSKNPKKTIKIFFKKKEKEYFKIMKQ